MHTYFQFALLLACLAFLVQCDAQACSGNTPCGTGLACCASQCYDTGKASCEINKQGNEVLCGFQHLPLTTPDAVCGTTCYDTADYGCCNSTEVLFQLGNEAACPSPAPTPTPGQNACNANTACASGLSCCNSMCYNTSLASCVTSNTGATVLCGFQHLPATTPDAACGTVCYDTITYGCCSNSQIYLLSMPSQCGSTDAPTTMAPTSSPTSVAPTSSPTTSAPNANCGNAPCGTGLSCCNGQCYNPGTASCVTSNTGATVLCGFQHLPLTTPDAACGTTCYDTITYGCCNESSIIYQLSNPAACAAVSNLVACGGDFCMNGWGCCASSCYDASAFTCVTGSNNQQMICNNGDAACGNYCFSPSSATCCNSVVYGLGASNPCGGVGNNGFEGNNGYNGYNGNGGYYYDQNGVFRDCSQNGAASISISFAVVLVSLLMLA